MEKIQKDIDLLASPFREKVKAFLIDVKIQGINNVMPFETRRSHARQAELFAIGRTIQNTKKPVTWTLKSLHLEWKAVDLVFMQWKTPTWSWDYPRLIEIAKKYWIRNLSPIETCHFEDESSMPLSIVTTNISALWGKANDEQKEVLHGCNEKLRTFI